MSPVGQWGHNQAMRVGSKRRFQGHRLRAKAPTVQKNGSNTGRGEGLMITQMSLFSSALRSIALLTLLPNFRGVQKADLSHTTLLLLHSGTGNRFTPILGDPWAKTRYDRDKPANVHAPLLPNQADRHPRAHRGHVYHPSAMVLLHWFHTHSGQRAYPSEHLSIPRPRFFNFCGQIGARLDADQTVYYRDKRRRSILLRIMSPFLFGAPDVHMKALKTIWMDQLVNHIPWKKFVDKLNDEWMGYTLYSTVILNSNVAFLALMNVSPQADQNAPANAPYPQTPAQIASYVSTVASMGSVIVGLLLLRQNRTKGRAVCRGCSIIGVLHDDGDEHDVRN
ncbi:hypothetical protein CONPUDRAFT_145883 [Coniophora puteana RWD-64-598 SS2]|uniref:Uncharacterized protein n=1 Tax=Coniophora puteana (strain RWD-64-598) TaxID=741705 RepID=A0A5M3MF00_CONPW|nr:uncharacterized protein CONPUDRAFT_145883 [Coniophora puteana RWD-64-598 SS2]EIW77586.1 hypothetical protein CONPUDRAFT_145883 [Coniophora puteana RWD-64-598 SS2]